MSLSSKDLLEPTSTERDEVIEYAKKKLGHHLPCFLSDGVLPPHLLQGDGTLGPLRDARDIEWNRSVVAVSRPSEKELAETRAWHDYCAEHGYPTGELCAADTDPGNSYPPSPEEWREAVWAGMTWSAIRRELRGEGALDQMDLFQQCERERVTA